MIISSHKDTAYVSHTDTSDVVHKDDAVSSIISGIPILGSPDIRQIHAIAATDIVFDSPVFDAPILRGSMEPLNITIGIPTLGSPTITQAHGLTAASIVAGIPVLNAPTAHHIHVLTAASIIAGVPDIDSPEIVVVRTLSVGSLVAGTPIFTPPEITNISFANISFDLPKTTFYLSCGSVISFDIPKTSLEIAATSQILSQLVGTIARSSLLFTANTEMLASIAFDLPETSMEVNTGAIIIADHAISTMSSVAYTEAIVWINITIPRTKTALAAINQAVAEISFTLLNTQIELTVNTQAAGIISGRIGTSSCLIAAINNAAANIDLNTPVPVFEFTAYQDTYGELIFLTPKPLCKLIASAYTTGIISQQSDKILRHVRGEVR